MIFKLDNTSTNVVPTGWNEQAYLVPVLNEPLVGTKLQNQSLQTGYNPLFSSE